MIFEHSKNMAASATEMEFGYFVLVSRTNRESANLVLAQSLEIRGSVNSHLQNLMKSFKDNDDIDASAFRSTVSSNCGSIMTEHIFQLFASNFADEEEDVVARTALCYSLLISWGEASAAREMALRWSTPVRTIQNRLRIARTRGILKSPGQGSRRGI